MLAPMPQSSDHDSIPLVIDAIAGCEELPEPLEIGPRTGQEDDLHGAGGGNSSLVPQLLTHSSTAAMGMASPLRSYSA